MYFVYHGYCSADNYDGPIYELTECTTEEQVLALHADFLEETNERDDISNPIFTVIEGTQLNIVPVETVTRYALT